MKAKLVLNYLSIFTLLFGVLSCEDDDDEIVVDYDNQIVFWSDFHGPPISVYIQGNLAGTIIAISSSSPDCGSSGNVTRTLSPGNYSYTANETSEPYRQWQGNFTIEETTNCLTYLLYTN